MWPQHLLDSSEMMSLFRISFLLSEFLFFVCFVFFKPMETIKSRWVRRERCSVEDPCWQSDRSVASGTEVWRWLQGLQSGDPERYNRNLSVWLPLNSPRAPRPLTVQRCFTSTLSTGGKSCDTDFPPCQTEATRSGLQHRRQLTNARRKKQKGKFQKVK